MTSPAAIFRASYSDWKLIRTRKCVQIIFEVPLEGGLAHAAYAALGGMPDPAAEAWVAIARLNPETVKEVMPDKPEHGNLPTNDTQSREEVMLDKRTTSEPPNDTSPASGPDIPARAHKPVAAEKQLAQLAGMLSKKKLFHQYLVKIHGWKGVTNDVAADFIRSYCGVGSRSNIIAGTFAGDKFEELNYAFNRWRDADKYVEASA